jgi:hypothetical protein
LITQFPFPALEEGALKQRIRLLGERLDSHRKRQQEQHPGLTLTGMYNVLEKLRRGEPLTAKEKQIHDQGLVTVLCQIHDELDDAVLEAYGWSDLSANGTHCSGGLRPSIANEEAPQLVPNGIDGHRPTLQDTSVASSNFSVSASQHFSVYQDALLTRLVASTTRAPPRKSEASSAGSARIIRIQPPKPATVTDRRYRKISPARKPPIIQNPTFKIQHLSLHGLTVCQSKSPSSANSSAVTTRVS